MSRAAGRKRRLIVVETDNQEQLARLLKLPAQPRRAVTKRRKKLLPVKARTPVRKRTRKQVRKPKRGFLPRKLKGKAKLFSVPKGLPQFSQGAFRRAAVLAPVIAAAVNGNGNGRRPRRIAATMSRKRRRRQAPMGGGSVTGGTGDIKPQYFTVSTNAIGAPDDYATVAAVTPIPRFGTTRNRSTVMEVLKVEWLLNLADDGDSAQHNVGFLSTAQIRANADTCTLATIGADMGNARVFGLVIRSKHLATSGAHNQTWPIVIDMTDANGNGVLVATDRIHITGGNVAGTAATGIFTAKILYRLVNIGINEYVGIVQGQQGL